jgi:hypothetical protein
MPNTKHSLGLIREIATDTIKEPDIHRSPKILIGGGGKYKIVQGKKEGIKQKIYPVEHH